MKYVVERVKIVRLKSSVTLSRQARPGSDIIRTYVDVKGLLDCLPYYVLSPKWMAFFNNETKTLHIYGIPYPDDLSASIEIGVGDEAAQVGDERIELEHPAVIVNDHIYVPLRPIVEAYGLVLEWDAKSKTATVSLPKASGVGATER